MFFNWFKYLLLPLAWLYGFVIKLRNKLYNHRLLRSAQFAIPIICVGNVSVGGTGKTPMVQYLITLLAARYQLAILSRGYKRKTKGFLISPEQTTAADLGDELFQLKTQNPTIPMAAAAHRTLAIPSILVAHPNTKVVIMDDGLQHRSLTPALSIVLTTYSNPYYADSFLPTGTLRDEVATVKRVPIIIVTKCPPNLSVQEKIDIQKKLNPLPHQSVFFTTLCYKPLYHFKTNQPAYCSADTHPLLLTAIAHSKPIYDQLKNQYASVSHLNYKDHHAFTLSDIKTLQATYHAITTSEKIIITTQKDIGKLLPYEPLLKDLPIYVLPIDIDFLFGEKARFDNLITNFVAIFLQNL